jgi:hypothetical protein
MFDESFEDQQEPEESTSTYKGHRLKSSEFVSAMPQQFRAAIGPVPGLIVVGISVAYFIRTK